MSKQGDGRTKHPLFRAYKAMLARCENPKTACFKNYGGRGIRVCDRWRSDFWQFVRDVGPKPTPQHSLDRINVDGDYNPENCRWATHREQYTNTRKIKLLMYRGEKRTVAELAKIANVNPETIRRRIFKYGWSVERSIKHKTHKLYEWAGEQKTASEIADAIGVPRTTMWNRLHTLGKTPKQSFTQGDLRCHRTTR